MTDKTKKTIEKLRKKADSGFMDGTRMPSIKAIHEALEDLGIKHWWWATTNTVEHRSVGRRYVNSRHAGKEGHEIKIDHAALRHGHLHMDTSDSYYSYNSQSHASDLLDVINNVRRTS